MGIVRVAEDVEAGVVVGGGGGAGGEVTEPLLRRCGDKEEDAKPKIRDDDQAEASECGSEGQQAGGGGSLRMVLVSTAVAVCGSFEFGTCVSPFPPPPPH
jgi:SP family facilitated glucose transporter-like MFS transporter 8